MSRRIQSEAKPVSLFSFLDSLICTMGALILLFMVMTNKIQKQAMDRALAERAAATAARQPEPEPVEEPEAIVPDPEPEVLPAEPRYTEEDRQRELADRAARRTRREAEWAKLVEEAKIKRDRELAAQRERQRALTEAELEFRRIKERMFATSQVSEATAQAREAVLSTEKKLKGQEEQVVQQIETTRRNLDLAERRQATASNEYALVPYDGTSGTLRRPIYIECTANGYRFIPENIFIGPEHLDGFSEAFNPLLTGTQALMRYWNARRKASGGSEPEPYVLLIVRPSGALSYYLARKLLTPLGANFGYELVDEDWKIASRDADAQARTALTDAIEVTVDARAKVRDSKGGSNGDSFVFNNRRFPRGAGFPEELVTGDGNEGGDEGTFAERAGNRSRGGGTPGAGGSYSGSGRERARAALGNGGSGATGNGAAAGRGSAGRGSAVGEPGGDAFAEGGMTGGGTTGGASGGRQRATASNVSGRPGLSGSNSGGDGAEPGSGTESGDETGTGFGASSGGSGRAGGTGTGGGTVADEASETRRARRAGRPGGARPATIGGGSANGGDEDGAGEGSGAGDYNRAARSGGTGGGPRAGAAGGNRSPSGGGTGGLGGEGMEVPPLEPLPDEMSPSHGHVPRVRSGNPGAEPGRLRDLEPDRDKPPADDGPDDMQPQPRAFGQSSGDRPWLPEDAPAVGSREGNSGGRGSRFAGPRGGGGGGGEPQRGGKRQWGNGRAGRAGIGLEKQLVIQARPDRLLIGPDEATIPVGRGEKNDELVNHVLAGIERTAQTWGAPPANFYWIPAVKFIVYPGGNGQYERLRGPLEKWGINSTVEYSVSESAAQPQGGARR